MPDEKWIRVKKGSQLALYSSEGRSGIQISVNKGRKTLIIGGWYDSFVGIESTEISLEELQALFLPEKK